MTQRLGKGLSDLIGTLPAAPAMVVMLPIDQIRTSRFQPRESISDASLAELTTSVQQAGIIEPIIVRPMAHGIYELVAGERRFRAAQATGLKEVPAIIRTLSDREAFGLSLVENLQRENLNPLEEAKGYARLLHEFGRTQEEIARVVGKDRTTVANALRILTLPEEIQQGIKEGVITMGHAKALLSVGDSVTQLELYQQVRSGAYSVRQTEELTTTVAPRRRRTQRRSEDPHVVQLEASLRQALGTKVTLLSRKRGGRLIIEYFSTDDLDRIARLLGVTGTLDEAGLY